VCKTNRKRVWSTKLHGYGDDEISRCMPGKEVFASVKEHGKRVHK
jgi:hypothetical protein